MMTMLNLETGRRILEAIHRSPAIRLVLMGCLILSGCAGLMTGYAGTAARPDNRVPLADLSNKAAVWQGKDMAVHYTAAVKAGELHISGSIERLSTIKHFPAVNYFRVYIHFLTTEGVILDSKLLWSAGAGADSTLMRWTFDRTYPLPAGAAAIGFSYRGAFSEGGNENSAGQIGWEVWEKP